MERDPKREQQEQRYRTERLLEDLESQINDSKKFLLSNQYIINRDSVLLALQNIRDTLPAAIQEAERVLTERERLLGEAQEIYDNTVSQAKAEATRKKMESKQLAEKIRADAQHAADAMYGDAERQAEEMVAHAEAQARDMVSQSTVMAEAQREASHLLAEARAEGQAALRKTREQCEALLRKAEEIAYGVANDLRDARIALDLDGDQPRQPRPPREGEG